MPTTLPDGDGCHASDWDALFTDVQHCAAAKDQPADGLAESGHSALEAGDAQMTDVPLDAAPRALDALAVIITSEGLPRGTAEEAPAWAAVFDRFGVAMETLVELHTSRLFPSWHASGMRLCIANPADARRLIADLDALAGRALASGDDGAEFWSSLALSRALDAAASDAAATAIAGIEADLVAQVATIARLRDAERHVNSAVASVTAAAEGAGPKGGATVNIAMQAVRAVLDAKAAVQDGDLARSFYSAVLNAASAFGAGQPPCLVDASSAALTALCRMRASPNTALIHRVLSLCDFGVPLIESHARRGPE
ncbi:hypothetical protein [Pandoravirus japonicus]|uniref:Uncharacterized protein n=1 Tax=Pandoravirus japonicus TaxID=2823154 RepID=A0A811BPX2_9VIRU|nr:hypothetical protein [Pandoravirus japonicus]